VNALTWEKFFQLEKSVGFKPNQTALVVSVALVAFVLVGKALGPPGTTTPIEMMYFNASSTLISNSTTLALGIIRKKPEVGLGVVGTYTLTQSLGKFWAT
jgi:hypothetical protein